jgi:hypothetical protein
LENPDVTAKTSFFQRMTHHHGEMTGRERVVVLPQQDPNMDMLNTMVKMAGPHMDEPFRLIFDIPGECGGFR